MKIFRDNASSKRLLLVDDWDVNITSEFVKSINYKGDIGHKRLKISSTESGYKEIVSF